MKRILAYSIFSIILSVCGYSQIVITSPAGGSTINNSQDNSLVISGTANWTPLTNGNNLTVTITDGTNTVQTTIPIVSNWSTGALNLASGSPGPLVEGTNNITIDAVTNGLTPLNATDVVVSYDKTVPSGYSVTLNQDPVLVANQTAVSFTFAGAEVGTTYNYSITSTGGGGPIVGSNTIATPTDVISGINVSPLNNGTLNLSVTLTDAAGNVGSAATDNATYDGTLPTFVNARFYDTDANGNIDEVLVQMSEPISDGSITLGNFSLAGVAPASVATTIDNPDDPESANDQYITFEVSISGTGVPGAAAAYTAGTLVGVDGNPVSSNAGITKVDAAPPLLTARSPLDDATGVGVNTNIVLTFSESVSVGTGNISIVDISGPDDRTITLPNGQISFSTNTVTINPSSDLNYFTNYAINVASTAVSDGTNTYAGLAGTTAYNFQTIGQVPTYTATWRDNNSDGVIDRLRLNFDIPVTVTDNDGAGFDAIQISGGVIQITETNYSGTTSQLDLIVTGVTTGTASPAVTIDYNTASTSTIVAQTGGQELVDNQTPTSITDGAPPIVLQAITLDANGDGVVDAMEVEFSEPMDDSDFSGGGYANWTLNDGAGAEVFTGFNTQVSTLAAVNAEDEYVTLTINTGIVGTDVMNYTYSGSSISDLAGTSNLATIVATAADDGAEPVIVDAVYLDTDVNGTVNRVDVSFSENITGSSYLLTDWSFPMGGLTASTGSISGSDVRINVTGAPADDTDLGTVTVQYTNNANLITDGINPAGTSSVVNVNDGAAPLLLSITPLDNATGVAINTNVVLTFTEDVSAGTGNLTLVDFNNVGADNRVIPIGDAQIVFSTNTVTVNPASDLSYFTDYAVNVISGAITDGTNSYAGIAGNSVFNFQTIGEVPTYTATWRDNDSDGVIDRLRLDFSIPVLVDDQDASGFDAIQISGGVITIQGAAGVYSGTTSQLDLVVSGVTSGTADPGETIDYNQASTSSIVAATGGQEIPDNDNPLTTTDGAPPVIIQAVTDDNNDNGYIDRLTLTFSENIDDGNSGGFDVTTIDVDGYTGEAKISGDDDNAEVIISFTEGSVGDTDVTPMVTLISGQVVDSDANSIGSNQNFNGTEDGAAPMIVAATTVDADLNGQIDGILIEMSEPIDDTGSTLDGSTFDLESPYDNNSPTASTGDTGDDEFVLITFNEESTPDTDATPDVTINMNTIQDQSLAMNELSSNETFTATADGAIPIILLGTNPSPQQDETGVEVSDARSITFSYSEDVTPVSLENIFIYNTTDLVNPVVSADITASEVSVVGTNVTWDHGELLDKGGSFVVQIEAGAFVDANGLLSNELPNVGDGRWKWNMEADGNPNYVYSPQDGATSIPPFALIYFYFDEPVRIQNSSNARLEVDIIDNYADNNSGTDQFTEDVDNYHNPPGNGDNDEIDNSPNHIPTFILPVHKVPCGSPYNCDPIENYTREKIFDISEISGYNSGNGYMDGEWYELRFRNSCFEDQVDDNDTDEFKIKFQIDATDAVRPSTTTFIPVDDSDDPADDPVDIETTTTLTINFDEDVVAGYGNIRLIANLDPDIVALNIPSTSPLVTIVGDQVTIDISGVTLAGNVEYYVNIDKGAFTDLVGNTHVGIDDDVTWNFIMEPELNAPEFTSLTPADNATGVDVNSDLIMVFNEPVKQGVGGNLNIRLSSNGYIVETVPSSSFIFDGTNVTIPLGQLGGLSGYYVNIDQNAIADLGDNKFPGITGSFAWSFTTSSDGSPPTAVTSTFSPADGSSGASVSTNITFFFDEVVSPIAGNNIEIRRESDGMLIEQFDVTDSEILVSGNQITINPTSDLSFITEYYVVVEAGAFEDASGNLSLAVGGDGNWNFTTGADASNPFIVTLSPADNASGITLSPVITIGFSESVTDQGSGVVNLLYTDGSLAHQLLLSDFDFSDDLNPTIDLSAEGITLSGNTEYFIEIPNTSFEDLSGLTFVGVAGNGNWSFTTTGDVLDPLPVGFPTGSGVAVTTDLILTFPEPVTANTGNITVRYIDLTVVEVINVSAAESSMGNTVHTIELNKDLSGGVEYYIDVEDGTFIDNSGNTSTGLTGSTDWNFTTADDGIAPSIVSLTPSNDATGVSTASASLVLTFNEPVALGSGNITLTYKDGVVLETFTTGNATLSNGNTTATITPYAVLDGITEYYVSVDNGFFEDSDGPPNVFNGITGDGSWSFITGTDAVNPIASGGVTPANGTSGNPVDPTLTITMNERVYAGSGVITISGGGQTVSINVLDGTQITGFGTNVISINPTESLINGTNYTVSVPAGAFEDPSGNPNGLFSWSFGVGNASIVTASNTIICTNQDYVGLNDLVITETANSDFLVGTSQTLVITLPAQFEFNTALTPGVNISGGDLTAGSAVVDFNTLTITYTTDGQSGGVDEIVVSNLEAKYIGVSAGTYNALRTGGTGNMKGNNVVHGQPHLIFDVNDPPIPPTLNSTFWQPDGSEDVLVPGSVPGFSVTATGVGSLTWYNNDYSESTPATSGVSLPYTSLPGLNPDNSFGTFDLSNADPALYTFYVTADDGTCESDGFKRNILVLDYIQSPGGLNFVGDVDEVTFTVSEPTNHAVTYTGPALIDELHSGGQSTIKFSPSAAGAGTFLMEIITTNNYTGEVVALPRDISVTATADIYSGVDLDIDYCETDGVLTFDARLDDIPGGQVFYGFSFDNTIITPAPVGWTPNAGYPGVLSNPTTGWQIDLDTVPVGEHRIERLVVDETSTNPAADYIVFLSADLNVYPNPTVEINDLPEYFCEDDIPFNLRATVTNTDFETIGTDNLIDENIVNVTSYFIEKLSGEGAGSFNTIGDGVTAQQFNPIDPLGDGTNAVGRYQITFNSLENADPNFPSDADSKGCINSDVRIVEVLPTPDLPEIITDLTGIGGVAGDRVFLQFCVGDTIPDIEVDVTSDETITWYKNSLLSTTYNGSGTQSNILKAEELFSTNTPNSAFNISIYATKTSYLDIDGMNYSGCESPPIVINIRVYEDPSLPTIDVASDAASQLNLNSYLFEYCDSYESDNVVFTSSLPDTEAYYNLYDSDTLLQTDWNAGSFEFSNISFDGDPGTDTTIFISRVLNDSTYVDADGQFAGCESGLIKLTINVYETSDAPPAAEFTGGRTDYYICSGDYLGTITSPAQANTRYAWYEDSDDDGLPDNRLNIAAFDDRFAIHSASKNEFGFSNENFTSEPITYNYWVTQFRDFNDVTNYIGCESDSTKLTITVFPDPGPPTFSAPVNTNIFRNITDFQYLEASYCEGKISGTESFILNGNTNAVFNWYRADPVDSTIDGNAVHSHIASQPVTGSQLKISDSGQDTIYFVVTQVNNIEPNSSEFEGCETEEDEMSFVTLYIYDVPALPGTMTGSFEFCEDVVFADGIELTGENGVTYRWYQDADNDGNIDGSTFFEGQIAQASDLGLLNEFGTGSYEFWVTQTQNIGDGVATFEGCPSNFRSITIFEVPPAVSSIEFDTAYCVDVLAGNSVIIEYQGVPNATFTWYDESFSPLQVSPALFFDTDQFEVGTYTYHITQTFNNCESPSTMVEFTIYDVPETPEFDEAANGTRIGDDYEFIYCRDEDVSSEVLYITNSSPGFTYEWAFNESLSQPLNIQGADNEADSIAFVNLGIGGNTATAGQFSRFVRSKVGTCFSNVRQFDITIGEAPVVSYTWEGLTKSPFDSTEFAFFNDNPAVLNNEIQEIRFTIDGIVEYYDLDGGGADLSNYVHHFLDSGKYQVELFMRTSEVCRDSVERTVQILDVVDVPAGGYLQTFEGTDHGWFDEKRQDDGKSDGRKSSWEVGVPVGSILSTDPLITSAFSGSNVWVTDLDSTYRNSEFSWVYSPAYDISALEIPVVSFFHQHYFANNRDGAVFQFSDDNGETWNTLGRLDEIDDNLTEPSGRNWYDGADIPTVPGDFKVNNILPQQYNQGGYGWTTQQNLEGWLETIHILENFDRESLIRFRFALSTNQGDEDEGFAFDDFRLYNSDKISLLESFFNASEPGAKLAYDDLNDAVNERAEGSIAWITYFTDLDMNNASGRDDINRANSYDPSARVGYYGIDGVPISALEGEVRKINANNQNDPNLSVRGFTRASLTIAGLESKKFDISLSKNNSENDILSVTGTFEALEDLEDAELSIRFMVIEREITGVEIGEFTPDDTLRNVLRKILPNAAGIVKIGDVNEGQIFTETVEWKISNIYDASELEVIAFIQNENAASGKREIYQTAILNGNFSDKQLILSVLDQLRNGEPFVVYPNPADDMFNLEILNPSKDVMDWKMYDQTGREVMTGQLAPGTMATEISTKELPGGVFLLQLFLQDAALESKRIMVIHE